MWDFVGVDGDTIVDSWTRGLRSVSQRSAVLSAEAVRRPADARLEVLVACFSFSIFSLVFRKTLAVNSLHCQGNRAPLALDQ